MPDLQLSMGVMHLVEFTFELEPQLDLLLVILVILHILSFKL